MSTKLEFAKKRRNLWNPFVDFLGLGGLSIMVVIVASMVFPATQEWFEPFRRSIQTESGELAVREGARHFNEITFCLCLTILLNHPHFMASYRLLYRARTQIRTYRWSSTGIPVVLGLVSIFVLFSGANESMLMTPATSLETFPYIGVCLLKTMNVGVMSYLGWHYCMQAWGIICTYLFLGKVRLVTKEKWMIKSGLMILVGVHIVLWLSASPMMYLEGVREVCLSFTPLIPFFVFPFFIAGGLGFYQAFKRTGQRIPLNAVTPWLAVYVWYYGVLNYYDILSIVIFVQLAHALQYLVVTTRVEANVGEKKYGRNGLMFTSGMYLILLALGYAVFELPGIVGMQLHAAAVYGTALTLLINSINLHHFFVDGAIWKISNPEVRKDLFAHVEGK